LLLNRLDICGWLIDNKPPGLIMGHEDNERLFLVHISSILHHALVGVLGVHYSPFLVTWKVG